MERHALTQKIHHSLLEIKTDDIEYWDGAGYANITER